MMEDISITFEEYENSDVRRLFTEWNNVLIERNKVMTQEMLDHELNTKLEELGL